MNNTLYLFRFNPLNLLAFNQWKTETESISRAVHLNTVFFQKLLHRKIYASSVSNVTTPSPAQKCDVRKHRTVGGSGDFTGMWLTSASVKVKTNSKKWVFVFTNETNQNAGMFSVAFSWRNEFKFFNVVMYKIRQLPTKVIELNFGNVFIIIFIKLPSVKNVNVKFFSSVISNIV